MVLVAILFLIVQSISYLTPPFQSPDEFHHLDRAYLLSKGEVFLESSNKVTGGDIDTGLLDYMNNFGGLRFKYEKKITAQAYQLSENIQWSGQRKFIGLPNTAAYFPISYIPQALALSIGGHAGLSVRHSYYLARLFSLMATLGILWAAFLLYPVPLIVVAFFVTPMTLFQLGSASLDAVSFAVTVLFASLYMRGTNNAYKFDSKMHIAFAICLFALVTTRINLIPLTLLPIVLYATRKNRIYLVSTFVLISLSFAWIGFVLKTVQGLSVRTLTTTEIIKFYLEHPVDFYHVFIATITDSGILKHYWSMFIGILGWLDTPLPQSAYIIYGVLLTALAFISFQRNRFCLQNGNCLSLAIATAPSIFLIFVIQLACWTNHPAKVIEGIQGRYFTPIFILLSFAVFNRRLSQLEIKIGLSVVFIMALLSVSIMGPTLRDRYWLSSNYSGYLDLDKENGTYKMQPSAQLSSSMPLQLMVTSGHREYEAGLERIGVMFGTYVRQNPGEAELRLKGPDGAEFVQRFSLPDLADNKYRYFDLDSKRYVSGEIVSITGDGVSTWESHSEKGGVNTCITYEYNNGKRRFTPGCPLF